MTITTTTAAIITCDVCGGEHELDQNDDTSSLQLCPDCDRQLTEAQRREQFVFISPV